MDQDPLEYRTQQALAQAVGELVGEDLSAAKIRAWKPRVAPWPESGPPYSEEHRTALAEWRLAHASAPGRPSSNGSEGTKHRIRLLKAMADKLEMQNAKTRGQMLEYDAVAAEILRDTASLKDWLLSALPTQAYDLAHAGHERLIAVERIQAAMIARLNEWASEVQPPAPSEPRAPVERVDGVAVGGVDTEAKA